MRSFIPTIRVTSRNFERAASSIRSRSHDLATVEPTVRAIIGDVRKNGDEAVLRLERKFGGADISRERLRVGQSEIERAGDRVGRPLLDAMKRSLGNLSGAQCELLKRLNFDYEANGFSMNVSARPLSAVGCYVPGGRAAYASSVLMTAGLARLAGVERVVVCTPAAPSGAVSDAILAAAGVCGVGEVYRTGGAQSIAALAYGTESIPKVQKIVGPGGIYVSAAKKLVSGDTGIDFFAGPTELVVVADESADPRTVAWDLIGQAEHGTDSLCGLVTFSNRFAASVRENIGRITPKLERRKFVEGCLRGGFAAVASDVKTAACFVDALAPEHLEVMLGDASGNFAKSISNAGLILCGPYSPCAASDYIIGTDHVLPTEGFAQKRAGLSVLDFVKLVWTVEGSREGLRSVLRPLKELAYAEGLPNHYLSVRSRFEGMENE